MNSEKHLQVFYKLNQLASGRRLNLNQFYCKGTNTAERWQTCIEHTDNIYGLGYAIARMFMAVSPYNSKTAAQTLIKSIKKSFIKNFETIPWMNNETRKLAEDKVNAVNELIGYPDFIQNDKLLNLK